MDIRKHRWVRFSLIFLAVLAAGIILKEVAAPGLVRRRLIAAVHDSCETCELSLGRVHISLLPLALSSGNVRFTGGTPNATVISVAAKRVYIPFSLFSLFKNRFRVGRIEIEQPAVTVTEGDLYAPSSEQSDQERPLDLEIEGIEVKKGSFTYVREHPGRKGSLEVSAINAAIGPVGTSERLRDKDVAASADGLLEHSGQFHLEIRAKIFAKVPDVDVKLQIAGQELAALNPFFEPNDGVKLHGKLLEGRSSAEIRGASLKASSYVRYRGLEVRIKKSEERGALAAFFQTFLASVTIRKQNADKGNFDRTGTVELERKPKETLISFTLRGMKEAAMKVSTQGSK
ncbi:MAG: DUF748 domain-containing protein [Elusimicrobiota bacterium]|nr:DUF748 domain-containing protein [Elusimicrobiota bacterium]